MELHQICHNDNINRIFWQYYNARNRNVSSIMDEVLVGISPEFGKLHIEFTPAVTETRESAPIETPTIIMTPDGDEVWTAIVKA